MFGPLADGRYTIANEHNFVLVTRSEGPVYMTDASAAEGAKKQWILENRPNGSITLKNVEHSNYVGREDDAPIMTGQSRPQELIPEPAGESFRLFVFDSGRKLYLQEMPSPPIFPPMILIGAVENAGSPLLFKFKPE